MVKKATVAKKTTKKKVEKAAKAVAIKRWWSYQLIRVGDEQGESFILAEVHWAQEGKKKPRIWYYQEATVAGDSPEVIAEKLMAMAEHSADLPVVEESDLPSEDDMDLGGRAGTLPISMGR
jgi:hypothetical protein